MLSWNSADIKFQRGIYKKCNIAGGFHTKYDMNMTQQRFETFGEVAMAVKLSDIKKFFNLKM